MSSIDGVGSVQGDDLVAEDVITRSEGLWDGGSPRPVVGDEDAGCPLLGGVINY